MEFGKIEVYEDEAEVYIPHIRRPGTGEQIRISRPHSDKPWGEKEMAEAFVYHLCKLVAGKNVKLHIIEEVLDPSILERIRSKDAKEAS